MIEALLIHSAGWNYSDRSLDRNVTSFHREIVESHLILCVSRLADLLLESGNFYWTKKRQVMLSSRAPCALDVRGRYLGWAIWCGGHVERKRRGATYGPIRGNFHLCCWKSNCFTSLFQSASLGPKALGNRVP